MTRFADCYDEAFPNQGALWWRAAQNALRGRRGQSILRELREALLAMPTKRLIEGAVVKGGEVCVIGALAAHRLLAGPLVLCKDYGGHSSFSSLAEMEERVGEWLDNEYETQAFGEKMGLPGTLAWMCAYQNDEEGWGSETPEQRYQRVLKWVLENIH